MTTIRLGPPPPLPAVPDLITLSPEELRQVALHADGTRARTVVGDVIVPVLQNLLGGLGAGIVVWLLVVGLLGLSGQAIPDALRYIAGGMGGLVASLATTFRFFGDELGIGQKLYRLGQDSQQGTIKALRVELNAANEMIVGLRRNGNAAPQNQLDRRTLLVRDARRILAWYYQGADITRRECETRGMTQPAWNKAMGLLTAANLRDDRGFLYPTLKEAKTALTDYLSELDGLAPHVLPFKE